MKPKLDDIKNVLDDISMQDTLPFQHSRLDVDQIK
jgi:hypothetical protein